VTGVTFQYIFGVRVTQRKLGFVVAESTCGGFPIAFEMAGRTDLSQVSIVFIVLLMTAYALFGCFLKHCAFVAFLALDLCVFSEQRKSTHVVIKFRWLLPASLSMATSALFAQ
jgi:hypothetical protein